MSWDTLIYASVLTRCDKSVIPRGSPHVMHVRNSTSQAALGLICLTGLSSDIKAHDSERRSKSCHANRRNIPARHIGSSKCAYRAISGVRAPVLRTFYVSALPLGTLARDSPPLTKSHPGLLNVSRPHPVV